MCKNTQLHSFEHKNAQILNDYNDIKQLNGINHSFFGNKLTHIFYGNIH